MNKALLTAALAASVFSGANAANSVSGSTKFSVEVPEILVLYHWDEAKLKLTSPNDKFVYPEPATSVRTKSLEIGANNAVTINANPITGNEIPATLKNKIKVTLEKSWAVRSISSGAVKLKVEATDPALTKKVGNETSTIKIKDAKVKTTNISSGTEISIPNQWNVTKGDITFSLDMTGIKLKGEHVSATDKTFTLTLTGN